MDYEIYKRITFGQEPETFWFALSIEGHVLNGPFNSLEDAIGEAQAVVDLVVPDSYSPEGKGKRLMDIY